MSTVPRIICDTCRLRHRACRWKEGDSICRACALKGLEDCNIAEERAATAGQSKGASQNGLQRTAITPTVNGTSVPHAVIDLWDSWSRGDHVLIAGFDIGTFFSSAAWTLVEKDQELTPGWRLNYKRVLDPGSNWQIPTYASCVAKDSNTCMIYSATDIEDHLGDFDGIHESEIMRFLKLSLLDGNEIPNEAFGEMVRRELEKQRGVLRSWLNRRGVITDVHKPLDVLSGFLSYLWTLFMSSVMKASNLAPEMVNRLLSKSSHSSSRIVVATPAIWSGTMNNKFRRMLLQAGFPNAHIRSEPKVAAAATAHMSPTQPRVERSPTDAEYRETLVAIQAIDKIAVDIGGGTADLNAYRLTEIWPRLKLDSLIVGDGSMSGSATLLNFLMRERLREIIRATLPALATSIKHTPDETLDSFINGWEVDKRNFSIDKTGAWKINFVSVKGEHVTFSKFASLPGLAHRYIRVNVEDVREVFDEYLAEIRRLIDLQISRLRQLRREHQHQKTEIILLGGGSLIPYISESLRLQYLTTPNISVSLEEDKDFSRVAQGCLLAAIDPTIGQREFARSTTGAVIYAPFNARLSNHKEDDAFKVKAEPFSNRDWELPRFTRIILENSNLADPRNAVTVDEWLEFAETDITWPLRLGLEVFEVVSPDLRTMEYLMITAIAKIYWELLLVTRSNMD